MAELVAPGAKLNIKLGQTPNISDPAWAGELQGIYNALHILNQYMDALRTEYEGNDSQDPATSLRFRRRYRSKALQAIKAGQIVSAYGDGHVLGAQCTVPPGCIIIIQGAVYPSLRQRVLVNAEVALSDAAVGEEVLVGADAGVVQINGVKAGQILWAPDRMRHISYHGALNGNFGVRGISSSYLSGAGSLSITGGQRYVYANNGAIIGYSEGTISASWRSGDYYYGDTLHYVPVGVGLQDNFALITGGYVHSPWPMS